MAKLKVPSLQHLARNWRDTPEKVCRELVSVVENPPSFSYTQLFSLVGDMVVFGNPLEEVVKAVNLRVKQESVRNNYLELLPLAHAYFNEAAPRYAHSVAGRMYPIGRGLMIPFNPPLVYGTEAGIRFPWLSFWRTNPLAGERLSLFVTVVDELLRQDADYDTAEFKILDFSAPKPKQPRELRVIDTRDIPKLSQSRKEEMLAVFCDGYALAQKQLSAGASEADARKSIDRPADDSQGDLFPE